MLNPSPPSHLRAYHTAAERSLNGTQQNTMLNSGANGTGAGQKPELNDLTRTVTAPDALLEAHSSTTSSHSAVGVKQSSRR